MITLHPDEKETIIRFDETMNPAKIETHNKTLASCLKKWISERPEDYKLIREDDEYGYIYAEIPRKRAIAAAKALRPAKGRKLTEEERVARAAQLKEWREKIKTA